MSTNQINVNQLEAIKELETSLNIEILGTDRILIDICGQIQNLTLGGCKVKNNHLKLISSLTSLKYLDLSKNQITEIKDLENLKSLEWLYLSNNLITEIKGLDSFKYLWCLDLCNNLITKITNLENVDFLENIELVGNLITEIKDLENLKSLRRLKWLNLESNPIINKKHKKQSYGIHI